MYAQLEKSKDNKSRAVANSVAQKKTNVKQEFGFVDNRPEAVAQKKFRIQKLKTNNSITSSGSHDCIQGQFTLNGSVMGVRHLGPIERWVRRYHPAQVNSFLRIKDGQDPVDIDTWLNQNFNESYNAIKSADSAMEDCQMLESMEDELLDGPGPSSVTLAYGEESCRGALAEVRKNPSLSRRGNRYIATTPSDSFPLDEESRMAREELEKRGGETLVNVDVRESPLEEESTLPFNTTDLRFRYPRTNRGTNPSTAKITSSYVERVAETGQGELAIPTPSMYRGNAGTRNSLYGSRGFQSSMQVSNVGATSVRSGPESECELGGYGYAHRMTDRVDERDGGVKGKTMVLARGTGNTSMSAGDEIREFNTWNDASHTPLRAGQLIRIINHSVDISDRTFRITEDYDPSNYQYIPETPPVEWIGSP